MDLFALISISILVGVVVGFLSGTLGVGGGTIFVPVFKLGYNMTPLGATATSLFTIIPTSISGAIAHLKNRTCIPSLGLAAGLGGAATSWIGVWLATISPEWATMVAAALVLLYSASTMLTKAIKLQRKQHASEESQDDRTEPSPLVDDAALTPHGFVRARKPQVITCACIGLAAGLMSGYVGVGGGFIMVPLMMQVVHLPMRLTSGTSLIAVMILAVPGTITQALYGNVDWLAGCFVALGAIPGAMLGSSLIHKIPELVLRYMFSCFLIVAALLLVLDQLSIF